MDLRTDEVSSKHIKSGYCCTKMYSYCLMYCILLPYMQTTGKCHSNGKESYDFCHKIYLKKGYYLAVL